MVLSEVLNVHGNEKSRHYTVMTCSIKHTLQRR